MGLFGWLRNSRKGTRSGAAAVATRTVGGREYTLGVPYLLPADAGEVNRLDFQHYMYRYALKGNYAAPLTHPRSILDVGTGTGRWAREMATLFPQANVIGLDVKIPATDDQADEGAGPDLRPPNYTFVPANVLEGLPFADASFDFVHQRLLILALPADRWQQALGELTRVTVPRGWVELVEADIWGDNNGPAGNALIGLVASASKQHGIDLSATHRLPAHVIAAGLVNVVQRVVKIPLGEWGGRLGRMAETDAVSAVEALKPLVTRGNEVATGQWDEMVAAWKEEIRTRQTSLVTYVIYGQRPS